MSEKKAVRLSRLPFKELKDKAKEIEGLKALNRFEIILALRPAEGRAAPETPNPRDIKPRIKALEAELKAAEGRQARRDLRRAKARLKRSSRLYLRAE